MEKELKGQYLSELVEAYKQTGILNGDQPKTQKNKRESMDRLLKWLGDKALTAQTENDYLLYLKVERNYKTNSISNENSRIRHFNNWLFDRDYMKKNWNKLLPKIKYETRSDDCYVDPLIVRDVIIAGTEPTPYVRRGQPGDNVLNRKRKLEYREGLLFNAAHGLRIGETIRLKGSDINLYDTPQPTFWIAPSKGHERVRHPLSPETVSLVKDRVSKERLFEITAKTCNLVLQRGCKKLGLNKEMTNHVLRHIYISNLAKNKVHITEIQRLARHKDIDITVRNYIHLNIDELAIAQATASPMARKYLTFDQRMQFVERMFEGLHLEESGVGIELKKSEHEMHIRLYEKEST